VSLDGPPQIHDQIRRVPKAFERLAKGVEALRKLRPQMTIRGRSTVQRANCHSLREIVQTAKQLELNSISFLAADVTSQAFNRPEGWTLERRNDVALDSEGVGRLAAEVDALIREHAADISSGFVAESAEKLWRIVLHFRAHLNQAPPVAPRCNAPWVSAVVEADGTVRPCFFHRTIGNIRDHSLIDVLNSRDAIDFRRQLDVASNPICQRCVCSLYFPVPAAEVS
jgi:MoaA/NifB/PqqE/SkfB family radical SAM enzyme